MKDIGHFPITFWFGVPEEYLHDADGKVDRKRIEEMKEAGFNLIVADYNTEDNKQVLSIASELGLYVTVYDGRIWQAMKAPEKREELLSSMVNDYKCYPSLHSYFVTDEPSSKDFKAIAELRQALHSIDPEHEAYVNLFPNYASAKQLGNDSYSEHIEEFIKTVAPEIVSYDHYHFMVTNAGEIKAENVDERERLIREAAVNKVERAGFFDNFEIVRELSLKYDIPYMLIVLLVAHGPYRNLTEAELRWEAFQSLAYGASRLSYFTYWTPGKNHDKDDFWKWNNAMISQNGEKTEHYFIVKDLNPEVMAIGDRLMGKKSIGVFHTASSPENQTKLFKGFGRISKIEGDAVTVGFFEDGYAIIANRSFTDTSDIMIHTSARMSIFDTYENEMMSFDCENGKYSVSLDAGDGMLVRFE